MSLHLTSSFTGHGIISFSIELEVGIPNNFLHRSEFNYDKDAVETKVQQC